MQTFLPYPDFAETMAALDDARLGKQRVEAYQILRQLAGTTRGWRNHPAVKMWRGYEPALFAYTVAACDEWVRRGFRNDMGETLRQEFPHLAVAPVEPPPWLGRDDIHASHRSNLLRKHPGHYAAHGWAEPDDLPYRWPIPGGKDPAFWGEGQEVGGGREEEGPPAQGDATQDEATEGHAQGGAEGDLEGDAEGDAADEAPAGIWTGDADVLNALDADPIIDEPAPSTP